MFFTNFLLAIFSFVDCAFSVILRDQCWIHWYEVLSYVSRVLDLTFTFLFHCEFTFVLDVRWISTFLLFFFCPTFLLLHIEIQFSQNHLLRRPYFLHWESWHLNHHYLLYVIIFVESSLLCCKDFFLPVCLHANATLLWLL